MTAATGARRRRKAERPKEILQAALAIFSERGFAAARLDDVAARAGITKGTIYVYFESKEELFIATVKEQCGPVFAHLTALMKAPQGPALDILRRHLVFAAEHMVDDPRGRDIMRIMLAEGHRFPALTDAWYAEVLDPAIRTIGAIVRYGVDRGEFREAPIQAYPQFMMAPVILCNIWKSLFDERCQMDIHRLIDAALDVFAHGLKADKSARPPSSPFETAAAPPPRGEGSRTIRKK